MEREKGDLCWGWGVGLRKIFGFHYATLAIPAFAELLLFNKPGFLELFQVSLSC